MPNSVFLSGPNSTSLIPLADNTYDLGSASFQWRSLYIGTSVVAGSSATLGWADAYLSRAAAGTVGLNQTGSIGVRLAVTTDDFFDVIGRVTTDAARVRIFKSSSGSGRLELDASGNDTAGQVSVYSNWSSGALDLALGAGGPEWLIDATNNNLAPIDNNARTIGTSSARLANVYSVLGNFSGTVDVGALAVASGGTMGWSDIYLSRLAAGQLGMNLDSTHGVVLDVNTDGRLRVLTRAGADTANISVDTVYGNAFSSKSNFGYIAANVADARWNFLDNAGTSGVGLNWATDGVLQVLTRAGADTATVRASAFTVGSTAGASFSGAVTNITVVNGIVTAAS